MSALILGALFLLWAGLAWANAEEKFRKQEGVRYMSAPYQKNTPDSKHVL